jgi:hypothetical protein
LTSPKGWANIYIGNEDYWNEVFWRIIGPLMLLILVGLAVWILYHRLPKVWEGDVFPHSYRLVWVVLIFQNALAQLVTGPYTVWNEMAFKIYYVLLFVISAAILHHFYNVSKGRSYHELKAVP